MSTDISCWFVPLVPTLPQGSLSIHERRDPCLICFCIGINCKYDGNEFSLSGNGLADGAISESEPFQPGKDALVFQEYSQRGEFTYNSEFRHLPERAN
jgi:hypothetical protein